MLVVLGAAALQAATLHNDGILGNSGETGASLVRYGLGVAAPAAPGVGVVVDAQGALWSRGGSGVLNRYALDGRLLGQYRIPGQAGSWNDNDLLTSVGGLLVLKQGDRVLTLDPKAEPGAEMKLLEPRATRISFGSRDGWLAAANRRELFLLQPASGATRPLGTLAGDPPWLEMGPDGTVYPVVDWKLQKWVDGKLVDGQSRACPGERPQLLDGDWFGHAWHGTIRRFDAELNPVPGVVLGGASGSFIGHLDQNTEIENGRGLVRIRPDLYAVSGMGGLIHLLAWQPAERQFTIVRRIGGIPVCRGLGLDRQGNVWWRSGSWKPSAAPDAPLLLQVNAPEAEGVGQVVMRDDDTMLAVGRLWGQPCFYYGALSGEVRADRIDKDCPLAKDPVGSALSRQGDRDVLLVVDPTGAARGYHINGGYRGDLGPVTLKLTTPGRDWTSLAMAGPDTLLAAVDGQIVQFARDGAGWAEQSRTTAYGGRIWIAVDAGRLWVADREHHVVRCLNLADRTPLAQFGTPGQAGTGLDALTAPEAIAARGERAVVFDAGNQRLVRLGLR
ncbi:MAG: hypothetical protein HZB16_09440 [Armatimonadetes bacterium]|nr:hypothetical protein [Armatimonadota bacterium]